MYPTATGCSKRVLMFLRECACSVSAPFPALPIDNCMSASLSLSLSCFFFFWYTERQELHQRWDSLRPARHSKVPNFGMICRFMNRSNSHVGAQLTQWTRFSFNRFHQQSRATCVVRQLVYFNSCSFHGPLLVLEISLERLRVTGTPSWKSPRFCCWPDTSTCWLRTTSWGFAPATSRPFATWEPARKSRGSPSATKASGACVFSLETPSAAALVRCASQGCVRTTFSPKKPKKM